MNHRAVANRAFSKLSSGKVEAVVRKLEKLGIENRDDVQYLKEADLTEGGLLRVVDARKLIDRLKSGNDHSGLHFESICTISKLKITCNLFSINLQKSVS